MLHGHAALAGVEIKPLLAFCAASLRVDFPAIRVRGVFGASSIFGPHEFYLVGTVLADERVVRTI